MKTHYVRPASPISRRARAVPLQITIPICSSHTSASISYIAAHKWRLSQVRSFPLFLLFNELFGKTKGAVCSATSRLLSSTCCIIGPRLKIRAVEMARQTPVATVRFARLFSLFTQLNSSLSLVYCSTLIFLLLCSDYNNNTDLHIGVTTSQGIIVEFDRHGLRRHTPTEKKSLWEQSLVVETVPEAWWDYWDETLTKVFVNCLIICCDCWHFNYRRQRTLRGRLRRTTRTRTTATRSSSPSCKRLAMANWVAWHQIGNQVTIGMHIWFWFSLLPQYAFLRTFHLPSNGRGGQVHQPLSQNSRSRLLHSLIVGWYRNSKAALKETATCFSSNKFEFVSRKHESSA